jgi:hypothetical protein
MHGPDDDPELPEDSLETLGYRADLNGAYFAKDLISYLKQSSIRHCHLMGRAFLDGNSDGSPKYNIIRQRSPVTHPWIILH